MTTTYSSYTDFGITVEGSPNPRKMVRQQIVEALRKYAEINPKRAEYRERAEEVTDVTLRIDDEVHRLTWDEFADYVCGDA